MKKLLLTSIAAALLACTGLSASTLAADPGGFATASHQSGCSPVTVAYVDTGQDAIALASIQKTKINDASTANVDRKKFAPTMGAKSVSPILNETDTVLWENNDSPALYAEHKGDILLPLIAHRFASDPMKVATITDHGRDKFEVGWGEVDNQLNIDTI